VVKPTSGKDDTGDLTFEQALAAVETIVRELEEGQLGLDDSLARYERGAKLLRRCHEQLQQTERRIELLAGIDAEGNPVTTPLDDTALSLEEKARQRGKRRSASGPPELGKDDSGPPHSE
jgi:exodeoxyribonuclease VII small subunit